MLYFNGNGAQFTPIADGRFYSVTVTESSRAAVDNVIRNGDTARFATYFATPAASAGWHDTALIFLFNDEDDSLRYSNTLTHNFYGDQKDIDELQRYVVASSTQGTPATGGAGVLEVYPSTFGRSFNLYLQGGSDVPWRSNAYGNDPPQTMTSAGCGPTAAAIIASGYDGTVTPETMRDILVNKMHGGTVANYSTNGGIKDALSRLGLGLRMETKRTSKQAILDCVRNGGQVYATTSSQVYAVSSHCIAIIDYRSPDQVYVAHGNARSKRYGWNSIDNVMNGLQSEILCIGGN